MNQERDITQDLAFAGQTIVKIRCVLDLHQMILFAGVCRSAIDLMWPRSLSEK